MSGNSIKVYADNAATTAVSNAGLDAMMHSLVHEFGNPSSSHAAGRQASKTLESARKIIAEKINAEPREIYFTSGGTESDNWAINVVAELGITENKRHIITSAFEHHAVLNTLKRLGTQGYRITLLPVHCDGVVRPEELEAAICKDTALVTIMYANNEVGTMQPISEIGKICRAHSVLFHTDAVQAVGHVPIDVNAQYIDMLSLSAHKFHGPKGVGALYCRKTVPLSPFIEGGSQERGKRAGTVNVPSIAGMVAALEEACLNMNESSAKVTQMREKLLNDLLRIEYASLNGHREKRLPGIVNLCFEGIEGEALLMLLDMAGICVSSGSACSSASADPSHVLLALGLPRDKANASIRISFGKYNTMEEVEYIVEKLPPIVSRLRAMSTSGKRLTQETSASK